MSIEQQLEAAQRSIQVLNQNIFGLAILVAVLLLCLIVSVVFGGLLYRSNQRLRDEVYSVRDELNDHRRMFRLVQIQDIFLGEKWVSTIDGGNTWQNVSINNAGARRVEGMADEEFIDRWMASQQYPSYLQRRGTPGVDRVFDQEDEVFYRRLGLSAQRAIVTPPPAPPTIVPAVPDEDDHWLARLGRSWYRIRHREGSDDQS